MMIYRPAMFQAMDVCQNVLINVGSSLEILINKNWNFNLKL